MMIPVLDVAGCPLLSRPVAIFSARLFGRHLRYRKPARRQLCVDCDATKSPDSLSVAIMTGGDEG